MSTKVLAKTAAIVSSRGVRDLANSAFVEETGASRLVRLSIYGATIVVGAFFVWAYFAAIQEVVQTTGILVPRDALRTIQHLEGGILSEVLVKPGQQVREGDVLVRLDGSVAEAQLAQSRSRLISLALEEERLRAFVADRRPDFESVTSGHENLKADQIQIFESEVEAKKSQIEVLNKQIQERRTELASARNEVQSLSEQMKLLRDEFEIHKSLYDRGLNPRLKFLEAQMNLVAAEGTYQKNRDRVPTLEAAVGSLNERRGDIEKQLKQDSLRRLGEVVAARAEVQETLASLQDRVERLVVRAPVSGLIQDVPLQANAGVLQPGGVVAEIVPTSGGLLVESRIATRDIGFLAVGQLVTVKVHAFDYARFGVIQGTLLSISPSTFLDSNNQPFYLAKIELDKNYVGENANANQVLPGMTVQSDITTGQKTVLEYMLKPLYTIVNEAFWER